jgi:hypothetical protein
MEVGEEGERFRAGTEPFPGRQLQRPFKKTAVYVVNRFHQLWINLLNQLAQTIVVPRRRHTGKLARE